MTCPLFRWAARLVDRAVTTALDTPPWARAEVIDFEPSDQFEMPDAMGIDYVPVDDDDEAVDHGPFCPGFSAPKIGRFPAIEATGECKCRPPTVTDLLARKTRWETERR